MFHTDEAIEKPELFAGLHNFLRFDFHRHPIAELAFLKLGDDFTHFFLPKPLRIAADRKLQVTGELELVPLLSAGIRLTLVAFDLGSVAQIELEHRLIAIGIQRIVAYIVHLSGKQQQVDADQNKQEDAECLPELVVLAHLGARRSFPASLLSSFALMRRQCSS